MKPVLVFDSGVGGLSIAAEIRRVLPGLPLAYVADNGFFPYGGRAPDELVDRIVAVAARAVDFADARLLVVACNTASTLALDALRARLAIPVVGVVPAIKPAAALTRTGVIGLLGTERTVTGRYTADLVARFAPGIEIVARAAPALVGLAEASLAGDDVDAALVAAELAPLLETTAAGRADVIVLACTHFPLLRPWLTAALPKEVAVIDSGAAVAARVASLVGMVDDERAGGGMLLVTADGPLLRRQLPAFARAGFAEPVDLLASHDQSNLLSSGP